MSDGPPRKIWLVAGEDSGDQLGAKLMRGLRALSDRPIRFGGVGGEAMGEQGFASLFPIDDVAVMGYLPVAARLRTLLRRPGRVLDRDALMDGAYAVERIVSDRTIDSHIRRLRGKFALLGAAPVETLPGFGYRLGPCD